MDRRQLLVGLAAAGVIEAAGAAAPPTRATTIVYIGTQGDAILAAGLDPATGALALIGPVASVERPTWLAIDPAKPVLYAVSETGNDGKSHGAVCSFAIDPASAGLCPLDRVDSGGGGPTYLSYDPRSRTIFVGNFGGGQVASIAVDRDGRLSPPTSVETDYGTGASAKQEMPHAHGATLDPGGRFVLTPDMGTDRAFVRRFDAATRRLSPGDPPFIATPPGSGPRHLVFSGDGRFLYVLTELAAEIRSFAWDARAGRATPLATVPIDPPGFTGTRSAAEIVLSADGQFLYASNRARSTLEVFAVDRANGAIRKVQDIATGGQRPRSFNIDPTGRWLVVGNQDSNTLTLFAIDRASGRLTQVGQPVPVPMKPVAFAFYRR